MLCAHTQVHRCPWKHEECIDGLKLELGVPVSHPTREVGTERGPLQEQQVFVTAERQDT